MGIFHFMLGIMPKSLQVVLNLVGLSGDKERGIKEMHIAAERALYSQNDAKMTLGLLYVYYKNDYTTGIGYLNELLKKYPKNVPILYAMGNIQAQLRKMDYAVDYFNKVLKLSDGTFSTFTMIANYRLGEALFRLNRFEESKKAFQQFILQSQGEKSFRASAFFRLGQTYALTGDTVNARKAFQRTLQCLPLTAEDRYGLRKAEEYLEKPIDSVDIELIKGVNSMESRKFSQAEALLTPLANNNTLSKEIRGEALYSLAEAYRLQKQYDRARSIFLEVVKLEPEEERWLLPWTYFHLSQVYYALGDKNLSQAARDKAKIYVGFDFHEWLLFQLERDITTIY
jgi:tetratricopeptide (TPR) repeat protein